MTYFQHGRRHAPDGTDPIPGTGGKIGAVASLISFGTPTVTADGAIHYFDLQDGISAAFETSDDTVFANMLDSGHSVYGLAVLIAPCTVRYDFDCRITGGTASVHTDAYMATSDGTLSNWQSGRTGGVTQDGWDGGLAANVTHISWSERVSYDVSDVPSIVTVYNAVEPFVDPTVTWNVWAVLESQVYMLNI